MHTKGKLTAVEGQLRDTIGHRIAIIMGDSTSDETDMDNAERFAACWNEFADLGLPTSEIPGSVAQLVEALQAMYNHFGGDEIVQDGIWNENYVKTCEKARAALSAFEKKWGE